MITAGDRQRRAGMQGQAQTNREEVTHNEGETGLASRLRPGETSAVTGTRFEQFRKKQNTHKTKSVTRSRRQKLYSRMSTEGTAASSRHAAGRASSHCCVHDRSLRSLAQKVGQ